MPKIVRITDTKAFRLADYEALVSQMPRFILRGPDLLAYMTKMATRGELHAIVEGEDLLGLIGFYANDVVTRQAYLSLIVVDRSLRGAGVGKLLFNVLVDSCQRTGMIGISLNVVGNNEPALRFYKRLGFSIIGPGQDEHHVVMQKNLK